MKSTIESSFPCHYLKEIISDPMSFNTTEGAYLRVLREFNYGINDLHSQSIRKSQGVLKKYCGSWRSTNGQKRGKVNCLGAYYSDWDPSYH